MSTILDLLNSNKPNLPFGYKIEPGIKLFELHEVRLDSLKTQKGIRQNITLIGENKTDKAKQFIKLFRFGIASDSYIKFPAIITIKLMQSLDLDVSYILSMNSSQFILSLGTFVESINKALNSKKKKPLLIISLDKEGYKYNDKMGYSFFLLDVAKTQEELKYTNPSYNKDEDPVLKEIENNNASKQEVVSEQPKQVYNDNTDDLPF